MVDDPLHAEIVEAIQVVLGDAPDPLRLVVRNGRVLETRAPRRCRGNTDTDPAAGAAPPRTPGRKARSRCCSGPASLPTAGRSRRSPSAGSANIAADSSLARLDPEHDLVAFAPLLQKRRDQLGRILQVGRHADDRVAAALQQRMVRRSDVPEVAGVDDDLDVPVARGDLPAGSRPCRRSTRCR